MAGLLWDRQPGAADVFRMKGVLSIAGGDRQHLLQVRQLPDGLLLCRARFDHSCSRTSGGASKPLQWRRKGPCWPHNACSCTRHTIRL